MDTELQIEAALRLLISNKRRTREEIEIFLTYFVYSFPEKWEYCVKLIKNHGAGFLLPYLFPKPENFKIKRSKEELLQAIEKVVKKGYLRLFLVWDDEDVLNYPEEYTEFFAKKYFCQFLKENPEPCKETIILGWTKEINHAYTFIKYLANKDLDFKDRDFTPKELQTIFRFSKPFTKNYLSDSERFLNFLRL